MLFAVVWIKTDFSPLVCDVSFPQIAIFFGDLSTALENGFYFGNLLNCCIFPAKKE